MSDKDLLRKPRELRPPRLCIFCGGTPISKEHIYADWMRKHLPSFSDTTHQVRHAFVNESGKTEFAVSAGQLNLKGDHRSKGLKVVCQKCNNGWMSLLQTRVRPTLEPLVQGQWRSMHNRDQQRALAMWAIMFTMVFEQADLKTSAISRQQMSEFKNKQSPTKNWAVWIAPYVGSRYQAGVRHRGVDYFIDESHRENIVSEKCNTQFTIGAAGNFFFLTFYSSETVVFDLMYKRIRNLALAIGLHRVFPAACFKQKLQLVDDRAFDSIIPMMSDMSIEDQKQSSDFY